MKKLLKIALLILIIALIGCEKEEINIPEEIKQSTFPKLSGRYECYCNEIMVNGYLSYDYIYWEFDETCKAFYYYEYRCYTGNILDSCYKEWIVEYSNNFYERRWDSEYDEWHSHSFEFVNNDSFKLDGELYKKCAK